MCSHTSEVCLSSSGRLETFLRKRIFERVWTMGNGKYCLRSLNRSCRSNPVVDPWTANRPVYTWSQCTLLQTHSCCLSIFDMPLKARFGPPGPKCVVHCIAMGGTSNSKSWFKSSNCHDIRPAFPISICFVRDCADIGKQRKLKLFL